MKSDRAAICDEAAPHSTVALKALSQNKVRSMLTALGIIIGVGAVISTVALGKGAAARVERAIANIGANMIWIEAGGVNRNGVRTGAYGTKTLLLEDMRAIEEYVPTLTNLTPRADTRVQIVYGNKDWNTSVWGAAPTSLSIKGWNIARRGKAPRG